MSTTTIDVTVRYFAAAKAAAGLEQEAIALAAGTTVTELVGALRDRDGELARVLDRCTFLCDGMAVRDPARRLKTNQTIDVLPPFAGG